jgi:hypothetical protein
LGIGLVIVIGDVKSPASLLLRVERDLREVRFHGLALWGVVHLLAEAVLATPWRERGLIIVPL